MNLRIDLIINAFVSVVFGYIFIKTLGPALYEWLYEKVTGRQLKKGDNFDSLIEKKKNALRNQGASQKEFAPSKKLREKSSDSKDFLQILKSHLANGDEEDLKKSIKLIESLQWGDHPTFKEVAKSIERDFALKLTTDQISRAFKELIQSKFYEKFKRQPLSFKEVTSILKLYVVIDSLEQGRRAPIIEKIYAINSLTLQQAIALHLYFDKNDRAKGLAQIQETEVPKPVGNSPIMSRYFKIIQDVENYQTKSLLKNIQNTFYLIKAITPLEELNKKSTTEQAYRVLGLAEGSTEEEAKKIYRKLAKVFHPDVLSGEGLNEAGKKIASENFTIVKMAYDIIKQNNK
ncbi:J domain-containing protein [Halobacteriovorax sp. GB3]|uniref:DnaJ domain-containing protein n=1 Tax=Halobacteriovorax sp. GB3 TaxID=2719615 RepID=UPI00235F3BB4|nr:J domain-containing protein [Halobacteriovorax sp. GB3]MDD0851953.1 J domain-containing protein [Halobacteriovorax sp. GB3]